MKLLQKRTLQSAASLMGVWFAISPSLALAQPSGEPKQAPTRGEAAPALTVESLLQAPPDASTDWKSLRGNVVIVDFWGTYCGPCVELIPHLNQLEERFRNEPVRFISVTDEGETAVRRFLKKRPRKGWIALDPDRSVFSAYGIRGIPIAALVDTEGKIAGWVNPGALVEKPQLITDLLKGRIAKEIAPTLSQSCIDGMALLFSDLAREGLGGADEGELPLCLILIRRARQNRGLPLAGESRGMRYDGVTAREAIARIFGIAPTAVLVDAPLPEDEKFDVVFRWLAPNLRAGQELLRQAVLSAFDVQARREERELPVYVLSLNRQQRPKWEPAPLRVKYDAETGLTAPNRALLSRMKAGEHFYWTTGDTEWLAFQLGHILDRPVVDEAGVEGNYLFYWPRGGETPDLKAVASVLRERFGLRLEPEKRKVNVLVVEPGERIPLSGGEK